MDFSLVSNKRLKIILDRRDMSCYNISFSTLDYSSSENKAVFTELISRAKRETGFDTDGYKLLIEAFPSNDGGAYIYITKLTARSLQPAKKETVGGGRYILRFSGTDGLIDGVRYMRGSGTDYVKLLEYRGGYFAEMNLSEYDPAQQKKILLNILEYADCIIDYKFISYLNEYGKVIK